MTRALSFTKASIKRRIEALREAGLVVTGITADGTLLTAVNAPELIPLQQDNAEQSEWADVKA
jgi:hypothetical protein